MGFRGDTFRLCEVHKLANQILEKKTLPICSVFWYNIYQLKLCEGARMPSCSEKSDII
jgi:hypothetical protein